MDDNGSKVERSGDQAFGKLTSHSSTGDLTAVGTQSDSQSTHLYASVTTPIVAPPEPRPKQDIPVITLRRSSSVDDIWLKFYSSRIASDFNINEEFDDAASQVSVDSVASESGATGSNKVQQWQTPNRSLRGIVEEGHAESEQMRSEPSLLVPKKFPKRAPNVSGSPKSSQSLIWRWLASTAVNPGPQANKQPNLRGSDENIRKDAFNSRELNAVAPTNW